jgi:hypothetical protein
VNIQTPFPQHTGNRLAAWLPIAAMVCLTVAPARAVEIFGPGSTWKYFIGTQEASAPPDAWRAVGFNTVGWSEGPAPLGYGEPDIVTPFPSSSAGGYLSVFFRKTFQIDNPNNISQLVLALRVDDGFVAWINGQEVGRANVPDGELAYDRTAITAGEPTTTTLDLTTDVASLLRAGANVLAVHVFNGNSTSSDLLLDGSLDATIDDSTPVVVGLVPPRDTTVPELSMIEVVFSESVTGVDAADLLINGQPAAKLNVVSPRQYIFEFSPLPEGKVTVTWALDHGITDLAVNPNPFAGGSWGYTVDPTPPPVEVVISEFMADNENGIKDGDGNRSEWIELYNPATEPVNLDGWFLTDTTNDLAKWRFPAVTLPGRGYLLVWASGKNRTNPLQPLHTNFGLDPDGEYLALVDHSRKVVSEFAPAFPAQRPDISYGRAAGDPSLLGFFQTPTPGAANSTSGPGFAPAPSFLLEGGLYTNSPLTVSLSTASGTIRYTTDGTVPTLASPTYSAPLVLNASTVIKARVFVDGLLPSTVVAQSYHLLDATAASFNSNLPVMVLNTFGRGIAQDVAPGGTRTRAAIVTFEPFRGRSSVRARPDFLGLCQVEIRGQTSAGFPKQPYNLEINDELGNDREVALLGLPPESDWVLYNPYSDKSFLQNPLTFELHEKMGRYAVRRRFAELFVDTNGGKLTYPTDYAGIYVLLEKIKVDANRVAIARLGPANNAEPEITGGYIFKKDKSSPGDRIFNTTGGGGFGGQELRYHEPKPREITTAQQTWLRNYLNAFEKALYSANWLKATGTNHYSHYIDVDSFVDNHWIVEFTKQIDGYRLSNYLHKDRGGKVKMEPIWDWNLSWGNADYLDGLNSSGWYYTQLGDVDHIWLRRLITGTTSGTSRQGDPDFNQKIIDRWSQLRTNILAAPNLLARIDELAAYLNEAQVRDFQKWPRLGTYIWPNPPIYSTPRTYAGIIANMKTWTQGRFNWIDRQFVPTPTISHGGGSVPPGLVFTLSAAAGTIYYTLDGSDPRLPGGAISPSAQIYSAPITVWDNARACARARSGTNWSGPIAATYVVQTPPLVISEIMYHPADPPPGSANVESDFEFIEFLNRGQAALELEGFRVTGGVDFVFARLALGVGQRVVVVKNRAAFTSRYPSQAGLVVGEFTGTLDDKGDHLVLEGRLREPILDFRYADEWQRLTDGFGFSLVLADEDAPLEPWDDAAAWRASSVVNGSPGEAEPPVPDLPRVVINEALTHTALPAVDEVELLNVSASPADITGWFLTDDFREPKKFRIPAGKGLLASGGFTRFTEDDFNVGGGGNVAFSLSSMGDELFLFSADAAGNLTGYFHGYDFAAARNGVTFGRHLTSTGEDHFVAQTRPTLGQPNAGPSVPAIVISELMYRPPDVFTNGYWWNNTEDEFIELHNRSGNAVDFFDPAHPTNTWRLAQAVEFTFPSNVTLAAGGYLLLVNFDPQKDTTQREAFRAKYGLSATVPLFGPYKGSLDNSDENVSLYAPDPPEPAGPNAGIVPYVLVDRVRYSDRAPWPDAADGTGHSLQRRSVSAYGNDPANWTAAAPTPGTAYTPGPAPTFTEQLADQHIQPGATATFRAMATGPGPLRYQWRFNGAILPGQTSDTLVLANVQVPQAGQYQVLALNAAGAAASRVAELRLLVPPTIYQQPASQRVAPGARVTFTVVASTINPPLTYQWFFNGAPITGATAAYYAIADAQPQHQGSYRVRLTDGTSTLESATADLKVLYAPELLVPVPPLQLSAVAGQTITLSAITRGVTPMLYRWQHTGPGGGTTILAEQVLDSNTAFLTLPKVTAGSAGTYTLVLTNEVHPATDLVFTNATLTVLADTDGDGLPNIWEDLHRLNPAVPGDALLDSDGDGMSNLHEYLAGTDPTDPTSYLRVERITATGVIELQFIAAANRTYSVEFKDSLDAPLWTRLADIVARGESRLETVVDPAPALTRFYRLVTPKQP